MKTINSYIKVKEVNLKPKSEQTTSAVLYVPPEQDPNLRRYAIISDVSSYPQLREAFYCYALYKDVVNLPDGFAAVKAENIIATEGKNA